MQSFRRPALSLMAHLRRFLTSHVRRLYETLKRRAAERTAELAGGEQRYRTLAMMSPDGISVTDVTGRIIACNEQFARLHGFETSEQVIGRFAVDFTGEEEYRRLYEKVASAFAQGKIARGIEIEVQRADGQRVLTEYSIAQAPWPGAPSGIAFISSIRDISEQRAIVAALEQHQAGLEDAVRQRTTDLYAEVDKRARLQEALSARVIELSNLQVLGKTVSFAYPVDEVIQIYLDRMVNAAHADVAELFLLRGDQMEPSGACSRLGLPLEQLRADAFAMNLCKRVLNERRASYIADMSAAEYTEDDGWRSDIVLSMLVLPLQSAHEFVGIVILWATVRNAFGGRLEFLDTAADMVAARLHNALMHRQMQERAAGLEETVTERTRELQAERDLTRAILDTVGESVVVTDNDGQILFANPATQALTGYSLDETLGQVLGFGWSAESLAKAWPEAPQTVREGRAWQGEIAGRRKDGTPYTASLTGTALYGANGSEPMGGVWVQKDITPLKEAARLKEKFVSNVSHELRTPISIIALGCDNLEAFHNKLGDRERLAMIHDIHEQAHLLNNLTENILRIAHIDGGALSGPRVSLDLSRLVQEETQALLPVVERKNHTLTVHGEGRPVVVGDEMQLRQIIRNLLDNAIKYTPDGGAIECRWDGKADAQATAPVGRSSEGPWVMLAVSDNGIGIPAADLPFIFERFYRVRSEGDIPGTGLGLAIAQELAAQHGGWLTVASTLGKGSTFTVYLPSCGEIRGGMVRSAETAGGQR